ncbi:hypothetical protein LPJ78_000967 [Coemansia sp. RSA 989]|nr:hypothetical protein LPJ68_005915 [Coemansia sp. RSA 1086]KAJ1747879.1 hypothetical protein LPJ79_004951 [Coemansia sp. RSA 1821]KAJ1867411.1 hypothetical protein LPJ78_000967 [Coemansia sp. RSA 989]KAJ1874933.1 hypothetical protein LPJ55_001147 [Coemansia sp. RSA 990]KAJ2631937.1 hypothetical protein H4R22_001621 [Coemansia sp. RSA 1290]KAJ2649106.1 hypothetical protein IWW40_003368 [Coemansia sp. RSA 1250]KAJ2671517.1 hypothetical protein IWW42_003302 [Coemansia sp. RSA 1085]
MANSLEAAYKQHKSELTGGVKTGRLIQAFNKQPTLIGESLDDLHSLNDPRFAQAPGPLIDANMRTEGVSRRPTSYYLGYDDNDKILWFQVNVDSQGDEILGESGWKNKR